MKSLLFLFLVLFAINTNACPYSSMAEIDSKLESFAHKLSNEDLIKIVNLKAKGKDALESGNIRKSEDIFNTALALCK